MTTSHVATVLTTVTAAVMLVACFIKPSEPRPVSDDSGMMDGASDDAIRPTEDALACTHAVHETFTGPGELNLPCATWGTSFGGDTYGGMRGTATRVGDELRIQGPPTTTFVEGCTSIPFKFANGASVRIPTISAHDSDYALFSVTATGYAPTGLQILRSSSLTQLIFVNHLGGAAASMTYLASAMQWFKLVPEMRASNHVIVGYYGPDGIAWSELGVDNFGPQPLDPTVTLALSAGGQDNEGYAAFDDLNAKTCPPLD